MSAELPAHVVVFDGVCNACNAWVRFLLRRDRQQRFHFAAMQSERGQALMRAHGLDPTDPRSFLYLDAGQAYTESTGILRVFAQLGGLWRAAAFLSLVPSVIRDPVYRWLARNRYRWFGRRAECALPSPADRARFLN